MRISDWSSDVCSSDLTLPLFALFFVAACALLGVFALIYALVTPYPELKLIRAGNAAAAISLSGALIGFAVPLAGVIENSVIMAYMLVWGVVAMIVQILSFVLARLLLPDLIRQTGAAPIRTAALVGSFPPTA